MPVTFHGKWTVEIQLGSGKPTRITIAGSDSSDGVFDGNDLRVIGIVTGSQWSILLEVFDPLIPAWREQVAQRSANYSLREGLITYLIGTEGQNQIKLQNLDPDLLPRKNPFNFEVPPGTLIPSGPPGS